MKVGVPFIRRAPSLLVAAVVLFALCLAAPAAHADPPVTVVSVAPPAAGTYAGGAVLDFVVTFSADATVNTVNGNPRLVLVLDDGQPRYAEYVSGTGTPDLTFRYTVATGDDSGSVDYTALDLTGGAIQDAQSADADLTLAPGSIGASLDGVAPTVTAITRGATPSPTNGTGATLTVTFSEPVTGLGTGNVSMNPTGSVSGTIASILPASPTSFTVAVTDVSGDGLLRLVIGAGGGNTPILDGAGNPMVTTFFAGGEGVAVDHTQPSASGVTMPDDGTYNNGATLDFVVTFLHETITVAGAPWLALDIGGTAASAAYVSGSGTDALTFRTTVAPGQDADSGISVGGMNVLAGSSVRDLAGNDANVQGIFTQAPGVLVDARIPAVLDVTLPDDGASTAGEALDFTVQYDTAVDVSGTPVVPLVFDSGAVDAEYVSGSGTDALTFRRVVADGDEDDDGVVVGSAVGLPGGSAIVSVDSGAPADLALGITEPESAGIRIDTHAPEVVSIAADDAGPTAAGSLIYMVSFSEPVTGVDAGAFELTGAGGATGAIDTVTPVSDALYRVVVAAGPGDGTLRLGFGVDAGLIADLAGNVLAGDLTGAATVTLVHPVAEPTPDPEPAPDPTPPPAATVVVSTPPPVVVAPPVVAPVQCVSRRSVRVTFVLPRGAHVRRTILRLGGVRIKTLGPGTTKATVSLVGRGKGAVTLTIDATTTKNKHLTAHRTYHPCATTPGPAGPLRPLAAAR
jgi:hypothetical protein